MPTIDRRDFLTLVGAGGVGAGAGFMLRESIKHPAEHLIPYPIPPEEFSPGVATWYNSVCSMCAAGCGISVRTREGRAKKIEGNPAHPVNQGRLCALGQASLNALYNPDRVTGPLARSDRDSALRPTSWQEGLRIVGDRLASLRAADNGAQVVFLTRDVQGHLADLIEAFMASLGSPQLLQHDLEYPTALYKATERVYGESELPYYDLENADLVISFGADFLGSWLSPVHHALAYGRSRQGQPGKRARYVQIEPRLSLSGAAADEWLPARPGSEAQLALAVARLLLDEGRYTGPGRDTIAAKLAPYTVDAVAADADISADLIRRLADDFAHAEAPLAIGGHALAQHSNGTSALSAVALLNYLAGNLGRRGGVLFNPSPALNAGPPHADLDDLKFLAEDAFAGRVQALIVLDANPAFTTPASFDMRAALHAIPLVVSLSSSLDETAEYADVVLPSHSALEAWGDRAPRPGVGIGTASVAQPVVAPLYDTRSAGDIVLGLAAASGFAAPRAANFEAWLKDGWRGIYARGGDTEGGFDAFWRDVVRAGVWSDGSRRDPDEAGIATTAFADFELPAAEFVGSETEFPYLLQPYFSPTLRDGRSANLPWLQELPDPLTKVVYDTWIELNPVTAEAIGVRDGDLVELSSEAGRVVVPALVYPAIRPDVVAMPMGQGHSGYGRYARGRGVSPLSIVAPAKDKLSGALAMGATRVGLARTGRRVKLRTTSGHSRDLGRGIVQTTAGNDSHASFRGIPITVDSA